MSATPDSHCSKLSRDAPDRACFSDGRAVAGPKWVGPGGSLGATDGILQCGVRHQELEVAAGTAFVSAEGSQPKEGTYFGSPISQ